MHDDQLKAIEAELARQDAAFEDFTRELSALGDVEIAVPQELLDEIEATCAPQVTPAAPTFGIRV